MTNSEDDVKYMSIHRNVFGSW